MNGLGMHKATWALATILSIGLFAPFSPNAAAQPPGVEDFIPMPPTVDAGEAESGEVAADLTASQKDYVRPAKTESDESSTKTLITDLTIFMLAIFVGFEVITKVPPTLHTPLMSGSNAISGITLVGAVLAGGDQHYTTSVVLAFFAVAFATVNVVGGFWVTHRMLGMFRKKR